MFCWNSGFQFAISGAKTKKKDKETTTVQEKLRLIFEKLDFLPNNMANGKMINNIDENIWSKIPKVNKPEAVL